nr:polyprenol reductase [Onthophagus taurus]
MYDFNWVQLVMCLMTVIMVFMSGILNNFEKYLPKSVSSSFRYGKFAGEKSAILEVPKAWFKHFYVFSSIASVAAFVLFVKVYCYDYETPDFILDGLDFALGAKRQISANPSRSFLAMFLITLQCVRRLYDTQFVSVFSKKARMNITHYSVGFIHYAAVMITLLGEAPKFTRDTVNMEINLKPTDFNEIDVFATYTFLWAWVHQYKAAVILAKLRKNEKGEVVSQSYQLPRGDWFDYISSPHSFAEILMYICLLMIIPRNITWWCITGWVLSNQVETSLLTHWWYQEKFEDLPKNRKAVFPFFL